MRLCLNNQLEKRVYTLWLQEGMGCNSTERVTIEHYGYSMVWDAIVLRELPLNTMVTAGDGMQ